MENASKALIIAGAILLSILIIGLGMFIYKQAAGVMKPDQLEELQATQYNAKFENYGDGIISGAQARQLFNTVKSHNISGAKDYTQYVVVAMSDQSDTTSNGCTKADTTGTAFNATFASNIKLYAGKNYQVSYGYDPHTGYVVAVGFTEQGK